MITRYNTFKTAEAVGAGIIFIGPQWELYSAAVRQVSPRVHCQVNHHVWRTVSDSILATLESEVHLQAERCFTA